MEQRDINQQQWNNADNWTGPVWCSIYFSKADSRVWVPKQIPALGWTLNLGRTGGLVWLLVFLIGLPLVMLGSIIIMQKLGY